MNRPLSERLYTRLLQRLALPVAERIQRMPVQRYLSHLERSQWLPPEEIRALQERKLQALLRHAYDRTPFYRQVFDQVNVRPEDVHSLDDLHRLPIITKDQVRASFPDGIIADNVERDRLIPYSSSGSTGEPFQFVMTRGEKAQRWADLFRFWRWTGWDFGVPYAIVERGAHLAFKSNPLASWVERNLTRVLHLPAFEVLEGNLDAYVKRVRHFSPRIIRGYSASVAQLAEHLAAQNEFFPLRAALTTGETLLPEQRAVIAERFQCPVFDGYGGEGMEIAFECERHSGWHINAEGLIVEIVDDGGHPLPPGELGQVVLTNLNNHAMPFIRYNIQDLAALGDESCACERGLPLLSRLEGRLVDVLTAPNGRRLVVQFFTRLFRAVEGVNQFQIVQKGDDLLMVKVLPTEAFGSEQRDFIEREVRTYIDDSMTVQLELVERIPSTTAGKRRLLIREMAG